MSDRKIETVATMGNIGRLDVGSFDSWLGLAPDNSPLVARDVGTRKSTPSKWNGHRLSPNRRVIVEGLHKKLTV